MLMVNNLMRKLGYIPTKELIEAAADLYLKEDSGKASDKNDFYYRCGNANAIGYICGRLGIKIVEEISKLLYETQKEHSLNFSLKQACDMDSKFIEKDRMLYGEIRGVTDKANYTCGFGIPPEYECTAEEKIKIEAPYHKYFNGGARTVLKKENNIEDIIKYMDVYDMNCISFM